MGVIVFDTAENAAAAQEVLKPPAGAGPELISCDLYEVGVRAAVSTGGCNGLGEDFRWCQPPEGLSRPAIEFTGNRIETRLGVNAEVASFGEVLTQRMVRNESLGHPR
jgi:hypothetical protein